VLGVWSCTVKLDEENPTNAALAHKNWFGPVQLRTSPVKCAAALCTCRKECNKCDLTAAQCFLLGHRNDWSRWFAISSPSPICCRSFSFMGGVAKEYITKTWMWKLFSQGHILSTPGGALTIMTHEELWHCD
jgi:hypothetical protein